MPFLAPLQEPIYALVRILTGFLFVQHGLQKIFGLFGGVPADTPTGLVWSAGLIELVGGLLVGIGFYAPVAAFVCSGTMAFAYFGFHQPQALLPILNRGELAILYCWIFLLIAARGSGIWSVDALRGEARA